MSALSEKKGKVLGAVSAVKTLLERYPVLINIQNDGSNTSFGFMLNILKIIGVSETEIINWVAKLLAGKGSDGVLDGIEQAVKAILLLNIKKLFTCSLNPFIPDELMYRTIGVNKMPIGGKGIEIDLDAVDTYGILSNCPVNQDGSVFYFDAKESDYNRDDSNDYLGGEYVHHSGYTVTELWKSRDFNAFLWFVINKGQSIGTEGNKLYWDNRVKFLDEFSKDPSLKERFFNTFQAKDAKIKTTKIPIKDSTISKAQIIRCEYKERPTNSINTNVLKVYINPDRYYATRKISYKTKDLKTHNVLWVNKTVFEFNYDYIYSLKLFNSKTLVAAVVNAILGLVSTISVNFSIKKEITAQQIRGIVNKMIISDDNDVNGSGGTGVSYENGVLDCFYKFSNDEYDRMLREARNKHDGTFTENGVTYDIDYDSLFDSINDISNAATLEEEVKAIAKALSSVGESLSGGSYGGQSLSQTTDGTGRGGVRYSANDKIGLSFGLDIITRLLEETVTQIVMQVLSPKVAILFKINAEIMGNADPQSDGWDLFLSDFQNLVMQLITEIKNMIMKQMLQWLLDELKPLLELFVSKVLLETVRYYKDLLAQLIGACGYAFGSGMGGSMYDDLYNLGFDNTNANSGNGDDIIPENNDPEWNNGKC